MISRSAFFYRVPTTMFLILLPLGMRADEVQKPASVVNEKRPPQRNYPPKIDGAKVEVYKTIGDVKLNIYIFHPEALTDADRRPAIVFFFGGGWRSGTPSQFQQHCKYLASRGMVAMTADYRVASRHHVTADKCVADAKSAIRWVRTHADRLRVDPDRIVAGGGSAGGHLAACTGTVVGFEAEEEDQSISSRPNAMALFNPAVVLASIPGKFQVDGTKLAELDDRMGVSAEKLSPFHQAMGDVPPSIVFHGKSDATVPYQTAELFAARVKELGGSCELKGYEREGHGFFNYGRKDNKSYDATIAALDKFFVDRGFLEGTGK